MNKKLSGRYMSTYEFVGSNILESEAIALFGPDWEAEDDVNQIQELCDHIYPNTYVVSLIPDCRFEDDIQVTPISHYMPSSSKWLQRYVDYILKVHPTIDAEASGYADGDPEYLENIPKEERRPDYEV